MRWTHVGREEVLQSFLHSVQSDSSEEEDHQHQIGEGGRHIHHLQQQQHSNTQLTWAREDHFKKLVDILPRDIVKLSNFWRSYSIVEFQVQWTSDHANT